MPSLDEILKKTKHKSAQITVVRQRPSIATDDRPYTDVLESLPPVNTESKPISNHEEIEHKPYTNETQERDTKGTQTVHITEAKAREKTQKEHKPYTKLNTTTKEIGHKPNTNSAQNMPISAIVGIQKDILFLLYEECKKVRSHITNPISLQYIADNLNIRFGSVKTSLQRLCEKGCIQRNGFKIGRGGWTAFELSNYTYNELLQYETQNKANTNRTQIEYKQDTKTNTQSDTNASSSSSLNILNTTTEISEEWGFDISQFKDIGFSLSQLKQLINVGSLKPTDIEQSLIEFHYDYENDSLPKNIKTSKINFLMGLLRRGSLYISEGYRTEQQRIDAEMAQRAKERNRRVMEEKFIAWEAALNDEDRKILENDIPVSLLSFYRTSGISSPEVKDFMFNYFCKKVIGA